VSKVRISLAAADRERLGAPEWLDVDAGAIGIGEMIEIEDELGLDLHKFLAGWPTGPRTLKGIVWIGLRRAGVNVPLAELEFTPFDSLYDSEAAGASAGKDLAEEPPSTPPSDSPTS
jgi:hypothetical protein